MCWCDPNIRQPYCGNNDCVPYKAGRKGAKVKADAEESFTNLILSVLNVCMYRHGDFNDGEGLNVAVVDLDEMNNLETAIKSVFGLSWCNLVEMTANDLEKLIKSKLKEAANVK